MGEGALDKYWAALKETYRQTYSEVAADHMVFPRNSGELAGHNAFGIINDEHNDMLAIWLQVEDGRIEGIAFSGEDCVACTACGSAVTELARGKTLEEAMKITPQDVLESLQGLPEEDQHCARLAVETLRAAIQDYRDQYG